MVILITDQASKRDWLLCLEVASIQDNNVIISLLQYMKKEYQGWSKENNSLEVRFNDCAIQLDQEEQEVGSWKILPLVTPPKVSYLCMVVITTYQSIFIGHQS